MRPQHEEFKSNTLSDQKKRKAKRDKAAVRFEEDEVLIKEGKELVKRRVLPPNVKTRVRKKTFFQRIGQTFLGEDAGSVGLYIVQDVLIPAAKETIQSMITGGIDMLLYGERGRSYSPIKRNRERTSYSSYYNNSPGRFDRREGTRSREISRTPGIHSDLDGISWERPGDAEEVMDALEETLEEYGQVSVADYYEMAGVGALTQWTDYKWGWLSLDRARIVRTHSGWELSLPRPRELR